MIIITQKARKKLKYNYELSNMWNVAPSLELKFQGNKLIKEARHNLKTKYLIKKKEENVREKETKP